MDTDFQGSLLHSMLPFWRCLRGHANSDFTKLGTSSKNSFWNSGPYFKVLKNYKANLGIVGNRICVVQSWRRLEFQSLEVRLQSRNRTTYQKPFTWRILPKPLWLVVSSCKPAWHYRDCGSLHALQPQIGRLLAIKYFGHQHRRTSSERNSSGLQYCSRTFTQYDCSHKHHQFI